MGVQLGNLKNLSSFLSFFFPKLDFEKKEFNKKNSEQLVICIIYIIDALIKGENLYYKRNLILPDGKNFFPGKIIDVMGNINFYLSKFDTKVFTFTQTERQTFIFIIENIIDYFKKKDVNIDSKDKKDLFIDNKFWIENFFKIFNQKIKGSVYLNKKIDSKKFFYMNDTLKNELIYVGSSISFSLSPFTIYKGYQSLFLSKLTESDLIFKDIITGKEVVVSNKNYDLKILEFLFSNFDFSDIYYLKKRIKGKHILYYEKSDLIENAFDFHREKLYKESYNILKEISIEGLNLPLLNLIQLRNLMNLNRILDVKKAAQKFILLYPYYEDGYEIMGDIYFKEENYELALNFYEKVLKLNQNKIVTAKMKKVKEIIGKNKNKLEKERNEYFYDISESVLYNEDKIIFREKELRQMIEILISSSRRNLLLIGENGVGKTALVSLLSRKILDDEVPDLLKNKRIKEINFVSLLTGSKYRGQFEEKVLKLLNEFKFKNEILVLEDIHLMMSTGTARGTSLDLVNILKQFLRENSIQVVATTNYEEYKNNIEKDNALLGFFQKINVNELSIDNTRVILSNIAKNVFSKENIMVSDEIISDIVESAKRSIRDKKLPDSAIMILERCISKVKYKVHDGKNTKFEVNQADVVEVLSDILNLPESNVSLSMKNRLIGLRDNLLNNIIGQDDAIERIVSNIITSKLDFDIKKNRPDGVFLFIGPTGVGKTETAIALAKALYGSEDYLIRIDMSEYMEKFTYSRFIGAAPGYVGYYDSNQLTDKVRQNPFSIILLDEIEKADSQLLNIFLQVFDAGRLTDSKGHVIDFSHSTVVMTSNIGTSLFSKIQMGYQSDLKGSNVSRASLLKSLKRYFSPEFLNRIDEIIIFKHLKDDDIKKIINIQLSETREYLKKQDKELVVQNDVIEYIIKNGYSKEYGARNISRTIKSSILEKIASISLEKEWNRAKHVVCSLDENEVDVKLEPVSAVSLDDSELIEEAGLE